MKKVLIAIDYNPCAQKIAETGFTFARAMNAEICILHAIADIAYYSMEYSPIMGFEGFGPECSFNTLEEQEKEAKRFLGAVVAHLGDTSIKTKVVDGRTSEAILQYAADYKADLIIMGAQNHNGFEKLIMGDVVAKVLKHSAIPILIVPTDKQNLNKILRQADAHQYL
jgi:nucleotide-binding universal stress UspA family protein